MIDKNCVLIIGAGASQVYGFPTGIELKNRVLDLLSFQPDNELLIKSFGISKVNNFRKSLLQSSKYSVDSFLENRSDFVDIGKFAMSKIIAACENINHLFMSQSAITGSRPRKYQIDGDWLAYLFNELMHSDFDNFRNNKIKFITFNYDRVIETYFFESLKNSFDKKDEQVANILNKFDIVHVHGQIGYLPWQINQKNKIRNFKSNWNSDLDMIDELKIASSEIKIIHEANKDSEEFIKARKFIADADKILFLGFGYSDRNMERLKIDFQNKDCWGTCKELTRAEIEGIQSKHFTYQMQFVPKVDCLDFLRNLSRGIFF